MYLRALSSARPADEPTHLADDFPEIADDFSLPACLAFVKANAHSTPLRLSGPVSMWLHYDVSSIRSARHCRSEADVAVIRSCPMCSARFAGRRSSCSCHRTPSSTSLSPPVHRRRRSTSSTRTRRPPRTRYPGRHHDTRRRSMRATCSSSPHCGCTPQRRHRESMWRSMSSSGGWRRGMRQARTCTGTEICRRTRQAGGTWRG